MNPVVADQHQELGQSVLVVLPDGPDRISRAGMVVVHVAVPSPGYLAAEFPRIFGRWAVLVAETQSSRNLWCQASGMLGAGSRACARH